MATGFASLLLSLTTKLIASIHGSPSSSSDPRATVLVDLQHLERMLRTIHAAISEEERRGIRGESGRLRVRELTGVLYDAEDVLDEYNYDLLRCQVESRAPPLALNKRKRDENDDDDDNEVWNAPSFPFVPMSDGLVDKLTKVREMFDEITKEWEDLELPECDAVRRHDVATEVPPLPTSSLVDESGIYGREDDLTEVTKLIFSDFGYKYSVIPIVGMGGVGKTTLVQLLFKNEKVCKEFNLMGWACAYEDFDVVQIMSTILESFTGQACHLTELSTLREGISNQVMGKRVFLVLDNVWNEEQSCWKNLQVPFLSAEIVRIVVTTRNHSVAKVTQPGATIYTLACLSEEHSWLLFQRCAFHGRVTDERSNLVEVGRRIVRRCNGLPLAVKALGGLLRYEVDEEMWRDVLESSLWELDDKQILPALQLSYNRMPMYLKPCFLFCSIYSKVDIFQRDELIRLWMAEGFIHHRGGKQLEDVGRDYFDELETRSFFQVSAEQVGNDTFAMHDIIHDLACYISGNDFSSIRLEDGANGYNLSTEVRHLRAIDQGKETKSLKELLSLHKPKPLRTFLFENPWNSIIKDDIPLVNLQCLRVLRTPDNGNKELSESIGSLKLLRYLKLSHSQIEKLPDSIYHLYNLQTLDLNRCGKIRKLPKEIGNLINLRYLRLPWNSRMERLPKSICQLDNLQHLNIFHCICLPFGFGKLTNLRSLNEFNVGRDRRHCGGITELKHLAEIRELSITGLENVVNMEDAKDTILKNKSLLCSLKLFWKDGGCRHGAAREAKEPNLADGEMGIAVLNSLEPHTNVAILHIWEFPGIRFPSWLGDPSFSRLTAVDLRVNRRCKILPRLGQLPSLKTLEVYFMEGVRSIGQEFRCNIYSENTASTALTLPSISEKCFPSLEELRFAYMTELEEWRDMVRGDFPRLRRFSILDCPKLRILPAIPPSVRYLNIRCCYKLSSLTLEENPWTLSALEGLAIEDCPDLTSIVGMQYMTSLIDLAFVNCNRLQFSLDERLPSLPKVVRIHNCPSITEWCQMHGLRYRLV